MFWISIIKYLTILVSLWIAYVIYKFISFILKMRKIGQVVDKFPMDPKHWLWGHMDKFPGPGEDGMAYFREMVQKYPRVSGFWIGNFIRPYVLVYHPETVKVVLKTSAPKSNNTGVYKFGKLWPGDGLLFSSGSKWHRNRRLLTNVFHFDALKHYISCDNQATEVFMEKLSSFAKSQEYFDAFHIATQLSFDVFLRCAFSFESDVQNSAQNLVYVQTVADMTKLVFKRNFQPLQHFDFIYKFTEDGKQFKKKADYAKQFSNRFIHERRKIIQCGLENKKYLDFLDILLRAKDENGNGLTDEEVREECDNFLFAAHDTTSATIAWTLYSLACHPQYQKLCQDEVDALLQGRHDETLEWNDLQNLPYLTMCIKEALRIHGIVPIIEREIEQPLVIDGIELPTGTSISINLYNLHNNPLIWKEPTKYDPERFSHENSKKMDPFAFVPFSAGPRNCIGQAFAMEEIKVVLARVLKKFSFVPDPSRKPEKTMAAIMKAVNGIFMKVTERAS